MTIPPPASYISGPLQPHLLYIHKPCIDKCFCLPHLSGALLLSGEILLANIEYRAFKGDKEASIYHIKNSYHMYVTIYQWGEKHH